jgi:hypothetical protein
MTTAAISPLLVIVATGNHFFFDAAAALIAGLGAALAAVLTRRPVAARG